MTRWRRLLIVPLSACQTRWLPQGTECTDSTAHIILEVTDNGKPALTSYRRIILSVHP